MAYASQIQTDGYRQVGGELVSCRAIEASGTHVEVLRRKSAGFISWRFRQPKLALFWFRGGVDAMQLRLAGKAVRSAVSANTNLALFPPSMDVDGEFNVNAYCDYAVAFFDPELIAKRLRYQFDRPLIAFGHENLQRGFDSLCQEAENADGIFDLYSEGWAMQAIGQLARIAGTRQPEEKKRGGLSVASLRRVREYIAEDVSRSLSTEELSEIAGVSRRHFLRAFQESTGQTPHRFVQGLRIVKARELLAATGLTVTEIALDCGFSHAQHFSTSFRAATGMSPLEFRKRR